MGQFIRTEKLIGKEALEKLAETSVIVFGVGGVGGFTVEALTRAGVGRIDIVDKDVVDETNINRQITALHNTLGKPKVEVMKERMLLINPDVKCRTFGIFYGTGFAEDNEIDFNDYDYIIDAVDNVTAKIKIIEEAKKAGKKVISSMGTGNKLSPEMFAISDIEKTKVCPLAKVVRKELRKKGIKNVKVLYSEEEPVITSREPASISTVPPVAGLLIANEVIKDICGL